MELLDLLNARWDDALRDHHRSWIAQDNQFHPVIEVVRRDFVVAAIFPFHKFDVGLHFAGGFGADAVIYALDAEFAMAHEDVPDEEAERLPRDTGLALTAVRPDGTSATVLHPYHRDSEGNVWYRDPLPQQNVTMAGDPYDALMAGFEKGRVYREMSSTMGPALGFSELEAEIRADCAIARALTELGIPISLMADDDRAAGIIEDVIKDMPFLTAEADRPNPDWN